MTENRITDSEIGSTVQAETINGGIHIGKQPGSDPMRGIYREIYATAVPLITLVGQATDKGKRKKLSHEILKAIESNARDCRDKLYGFAPDMDLFAPTETREAFLAFRRALLRMEHHSHALSMIPEIIMDASHLLEVCTETGNALVSFRDAVRRENFPRQH